MKVPKPLLWLLPFATLMLCAPAAHPQEAEGQHAADTAHDSFNEKTEEILDYLKIDPRGLHQVVTEKKKFWQDGKAFRFGGCGFIEFNKDMTQVIAYYRDDDSIATGEGLTRAQAEKRVLSTLETCGIMADRSGAELYPPMRISLTGSQSGAWGYNAMWRFHNVLVDSGVSVQLDHVGNVRRILSRPFILPESHIPKLSEQQARAIADKYYREDLEGQGKAKEPGQLQIVYSNPASHDVPYLRQTPETCLAWLIDFVPGSPDRGEWLIYVDAIDGKIVGKDMPEHCCPQPAISF